LIDATLATNVSALKSQARVHAICPKPADLIQNVVDVWHMLSSRLPCTCPARQERWAWQHRNAELGEVLLDAYTQHGAACSHRARIQSKEIECLSVVLWCRYRHAMACAATVVDRASRYKGGTAVKDNVQSGGVSVAHRLRISHSVPVCDDRRSICIRLGLGTHRCAVV